MADQPKNQELIELEDISIAEPLQNTDFDDFDSSSFSNKMLITETEHASSDATHISKAEHALSDDKSITPTITLLFILLGLGPSWLLSDAMFIQIPFWQRSQPEGLSLANKMTVSGVMPLVTVIPIYFIIINNTGTTQLSFRTLSYVLIAIQIISCILISIGWSLTIGKVSITIHFVTYTASFVGNMMLFAIIPWIASINHKLSAPILTGTNLGTVSAAITGLMQQPGADKPLFGPSIFYIIWVFVLLTALGSLIYLDRKYLGNIEIALQKHHRTKQQINLLKQRERYKKTKCPKISMIISSFALPIWWKEVWKFAALNAYIQLVTWVFIRSTIPFAVRNASTEREGDNTKMEQYAIELSYVAVFVGSIVAIFIEIKQTKYFWYLIAVYNIFAMVFLVISLDEGGLWVFWGSDGFVVVLVIMMRLIDGYMSPLIYQNIARKYPNKAHEMNQWVSATASIAGFIGVWITYILVEYHVV